MWCGAPWVSWWCARSDVFPAVESYQAQNSCPGIAGLSGTTVAEFHARAYASTVNLTFPYSNTTSLVAYILSVMWCNVQRVSEDLGSGQRKLMFVTCTLVCYSPKGVRK